MANERRLTSVSTLPLKMRYGVPIWGKMG